MELPLIVGVDGSQASLQAVDWAVDEAARRELPLRLVYASLWERYEGSRPSFSTDRPAEEIIPEHIAASCAERARLRNPDVKVSSEVLPDDAVAVLLREGHEAFALVTGSRGRGELAGVLLGSVSFAVAARAVCPVIVVRGMEQNRQGSFQRVVVGVGDSPEGSAAVRFAFHEAEARGCALHVVRAWRCPMRESADLSGDAAREHRERAERILSDALRGAAADHRPVRVFRDVTEGPAHKVLVDASAKADLLVVGAPRRHGHPDLQLGRVAHALLHHAACPVAVIPQGA
jgi:nucleotide-binding universal stress UspA family protein